MIGLLIGIAALAFLIERLWPAGSLPKVKGWWARVALVNLCQLGVVVLAGLTWDQWLSQASVFSISDHLHPVASALVAYLVSCAVFYWWHRFRHESDWFWRVCHQVHHSPRRLEVLTSFYKHPVEIALNSIITGVLVYGLLGCDVVAAGIYVLMIGTAEYFYHWNVRTPRWLGWIIQRPESHRVHHQYRKHTMNYADLPIFDLLFGTFENPDKRINRCGFSPRREAQLGEMLLFKNVHDPEFSPTCFGCRKRWTCQAARESVELETERRAA